MRWCLASLYYFIRTGNYLGRPPIHQIQITRDRVFRFLLVYFFLAISNLGVWSDAARFGSIVFSESQLSEGESRRDFKKSYCSLVLWMRSTVPRNPMIIWTEEGSSTFLKRSYSRSIARLHRL